MFSGGLDSLAGAIDEVVNQKRRVVLVTHKSTSKLNKRHKALEEMLTEKAGENRPHRITVRVHKTKELNHEYTQRSRSFLYMSIGATIAKMLRLNSVRFYENGVISLNLPVCAQVVGGRATRTTHPRVMKGFQDIITLVAGEPFTIENPYIWKTKADVVKVITDAGCQDLIKHSMTCTHTWEMSNQHTHCGGCSQCIDRRFAVLAANADQHDPVEHYKFDVFTQSRDKGEDKIMAAAYLERANQVKKLTDVSQFISSYPDVGRVFKYLNYNSAGQAAQRVFDLYKRHANEVMGSVSWVDHYQVIQCGGCESISFRHTSWFSEDADPMSGESGETERLYPKRGLETLPTKPYYNVPSNLRRIYSELIDCFNNDSPTLCAAGLRAIVEGICAERGVVDGPVEQTLKDGSKKIVRKDDLRGRISGLQEKGLLTQTSSDTLHEHRYLGNDAVHQLARPSTDELRLAIEIVEHTLEQLYELPEKAEELKRAKALRQKKQSKAHP